MAYRDTTMITLLPATDVSASGTGTACTGLTGYVNLLAILNCSAVPVAGAPTLDVYLQTTMDAGVTWQDIAHTQITTAAAKRFVQIAGDAAGAVAPIAAADAALAGETVRQGPWGDCLRLKWVFAAGGSTGSYTLSASGYLK